jgi:hypothetical protein
MRIKCHIQFRPLVTLALYVVAVTSAAHSEFDFGFLMSESLYLYVLANSAAVVTMPEVGSRPTSRVGQRNRAGKSIDYDKVRWYDIAWHYV